MDGDVKPVPSPEHARTRSWGGPAAWVELQRIADDARVRAGFEVSAVEVLRGDGLLELVAFTGRRNDAADTGDNFSLTVVRRVLGEGRRYGRLTFLAEEDMDADLRDLVRGYGYVPSLPDSEDDGAWRALDMLVAHLTDGSGRTRAVLHLDEPVSGRRPAPEELRHIAEDLESLFQAVLATIDREELTRQARLDETARAVVRAASRRIGGRALLEQVHAELVSGFRARSLAVHLLDAPLEPATSADGAADLPSRLRPAVEAAIRRAWDSRTVIVVEPGRVWGDEDLDRFTAGDLTEHLLAHTATEALLVPVGAGHEPLGALVVVRDAAEDRWTESESRAALGVGHDLGRALLSARAQEREQHLIEELQRLDTYRSQLIATVSHELKNPLGVIVGHLEMLESVPGMPESAGRSLRALWRSAARLTSVVDDLLLLSRMENPTDPLIRLPIDLVAVLAEIVEDESLRAARQEVTLHTAPREAPLLVPGEPEEVRRLVGNLVSNAVKYSRPGGRVELSLDEGPEEVVFTCTDDGIGISEADRAQLFTEFFRSTNPEALQRPGTGLGLAIVTRIVSRHAGRIEVDSQLGVGTSFHVTLPLTLSRAS